VEKANQSLKEVKSLVAAIVPPVIDTAGIGKEDTI
jgi:hypothetical protein